jgi:capsule biosynthesis phosphatase
MKIVIDLDGTITVDDKRKTYDQKDPNTRVIETIKNLHEDQVLIYTARQMRTYNGNLEDLEKYTRPVAEDWLKRNEVSYGKLVLGKVWCEKGGYYVDDRNLSIEEFVFKFSGPYKDKTLTVCVSCLNESDAVFGLYEEIAKLDRLFHLENIVLVDNGSLDNTLELLQEIEMLDSRVILVSNDASLGYGQGFKKALEKAKSDMVLTLHADLQYLPYSFFHTHLKTIEKFGSAQNIIPYRVNRPKTAWLSTSILHKLMIILAGGKRIPDFNGQPKLISRDQLNISALPNDFTFDYCLVKQLESFETLAIIEHERSTGNSSWSASFSKRFGIFLTYLRSAL